MLLSHLAGVIARRWIIGVVGLLATAAAAVAAVKVVPPEYSVTSTVLLVPPVDTSQPGANPYLSLGGLTPPAEVLARAMSDPATEKALRDQGATGTWTVDRDYLTSAPILIVTTQNTTVSQAQATSAIILKTIPTQLQTLQAAVNVPVSAMISSSVVNRDADQQKVVKPLIRAVLVLVVLGLILTVGVAAIVDALAQRRGTPAGRRRRSRRSGPTSGTPPEAQQTRSPVRRRPTLVSATERDDDQSAPFGDGSSSRRSSEGTDDTDSLRETVVPPTLVRSGRGLRSR